MITLISYDKCSTCRKAEKWLQDNNISYEKRPIKEKNPSKAEIKKWKEKSGLPIKKFFNTSGQLYREMNLKEKLNDLSEDEMYDLLATDGMLVKRPLIVSEDIVLTGFKEAEWEEKIK